VAACDLILSVLRASNSALRALSALRASAYVARQLSDCPAKQRPGAALRVDYGSRSIIKFSFSSQRLNDDPYRHKTQPICYTDTARVRMQNFAACVAPFQRRWVTDAKATFNYYIYMSRLYIFLKLE